MLSLQFIGQNIHFAINLFAALVCFAVFWLYLDAWMAKRALKELIAWVSFLLIALSFLVNATIVEHSVPGESMLGPLALTLSLLLRGFGYLGIIIGQILDPLQKVPELQGIDEKQFSEPTVDTAETTKPKHHKISKKTHAVGLIGVGPASQVLVPMGALAIAYLYWRRATTGLERHYKRVAIAFGFLFAFDAIALARLWRESSNPVLQRLVESFGPLWIAEQALLLIGVVVLGSWVWGYLTRRFMSQLFMIFTALTLAIFLLTTVSFTFLLVNNVKDSSLDNLNTAAGVLSYAIDGKKSETLANTQSVAENPQIAAAVQSGDHRALVAATSSFLRDKKLSSLIITSGSGQVLLRAEDPDRFGDSLSSDTLIRRALVGQASSTVSTREGVLAPVIAIKSAVPIRSADGLIIGTAVAGLIADNAFVDGIKRDTGLDSAIYAGNIRSATTFVAPDGRSRWIGIKENNKEVVSTVLKSKKTFKGSVDIQNRQYLAVYTPLKDVDNTVIGMLFVGQPQIKTLEAAGRSVELTFLVTALLLMLSIIPAYVLSKYLASQLD